ncbi:hypothetical protein K493DRAFT_340224 [Basidiobolus meristosporus CBS 931.73]|uniref:Carbohydrate-binding domain-containing protein n=1 Tax=Basidiobolus meristosporus CBS 931.73 TaxID=1314790 RepID=A0A1Y1XWI1_9FUNG|nr:hypothetical protein K493DRAFT_340224 [Basidiobolus meristosporus CBS 931.73]|eukprot:ORX90117.1 hypothetical protein K493DRAFT_340224 [Basidiobolus meristosporus CBS 931.73]
MRLSEVLKSFVVLGLASTSLGNNTACKVPSPKTHVSYRASGPIVLDGKLDDPAWEKVPWTDYFGNIQGPAGIAPPPVMNTRVKIMFDDEYIYVGAQIDEEVIRAKTKYCEGEKWDDNDFQFYLDAERTNTNLKVIKMNALGLYESLIYDKPPSNKGVGKPWDIKSKFEFKVYTNGKVNDPRWTKVKGGYWSVEWKLHKSLLSNKASTKRDVEGVPAYQNMNFLRTGYNPTSVYPLPDQTNFTSTASLFFGIPPVVNSPVMRKRHEVTSRYQFSWTPQYSNDPTNPDLWGHVEFKDTTDTSVPFVEDPNYATRYALIQVYLAQQAYAAKNQGKFANVYSKLNLDSEVIGKCVPVPKIKVSNDCLNFDAFIKKSKVVGTINDTREIIFKAHA